MECVLVATVKCVLTHLRMLSKIVLYNLFERCTMNYRLDKYGNELSVLGFGCMRFPQKLGRIDMAETEREIMAAIEAE